MVDNMQEPWKSTAAGASGPMGGAWDAWGEEGGRA